MHFNAASQVCQDNFGIAAKFPEDLPAGAARRREHTGFGDHRDSIKAVLAIGKRFENSHALGTSERP